jgi:predicted sugar kinase
VGVVQSSWGPTLCAFFSDAASAADVASRMSGQFAEMTFTIAAARNYGAGIELR